MVWYHWCTYEKLITIINLYVSAQSVFIVCTLFFFFNNIITRVFVKRRLQFNTVLKYRLAYRYVRGVLIKTQNKFVLNYLQKSKTVLNRLLSKYCLLYSFNSAFSLVLLFLNYIFIFFKVVALFCYIALQKVLLTSQKCRKPIQTNMMVMLAFIYFQTQQFLFGKSRM